MEMCGNICYCVALCGCAKCSIHILATKALRSCGVILYFPCFESIVLLAFNRRLYIIWSTVFLCTFNFLATCLTVNRSSIGHLLSYADCCLCVTCIFYFLLPNVTALTSTPMPSRTPKRLLTPTPYMSKV